MTEDRRPVEAQALGPAGEAFQFVQGRDGEGREAEGGQRELGPFQAQGGQGQQAAQRQPDGWPPAGRAACPAQLGHRQPGGIGAQTQEGHVAQVDLAQVTHGHVQADEQHAVDRQQGEQAQGVGVAPQGNRGQEGKDDELGSRGGAGFAHLKPSGSRLCRTRPSGRTARARISKTRPGASRQPLPR